VVGEIRLCWQFDRPEILRPFLLELAVVKADVVLEAALVSGCQAVVDGRQYSLV
jgi:hypothetical protein